MTDFEYLQSPLQQLNTRDRLKSLEGVMEKYGIRTPAELNTVLRRAAMRERLIRGFARSDVD